MLCSVNRAWTKTGKACARVCVCVCVFLYVLYIDYQSILSPGKLKTFLGSEEIMAGLAGEKLKCIFRVKTWLRNVICL